MWIALIPALAWGSIGLISGKLGGNANQQTLGMTWGALLFAIVTTIVAPGNFLANNNWQVRPKSTVSRNESSRDLQDRAALNGGTIGD